MDAPEYQLFGPRDHLGFARNVNVHGSYYGTDNAAIVDATPQVVFEWIAAKIARLGWHIVVHFEGQDLGEAAPLVRRMAGIVVVIRMRRADVTEGVEDAAPRAILYVFQELLSTKVRCGAAGEVASSTRGRGVLVSRTLNNNTQRQDGHA
ncbi:hypothetical protein [Mameliella sp.]|uniref:hypothetical protein n=1 Tax=Mameliella sp. TaxID=1924940 RepID=UPI003B5074DE